jgi:hypothetical protein
MANSPNTQPIFIRTPVIHSLVLSSELGDLLPTSTLVPKLLLSGSDPATLIETIEIQSTGVRVASALNLYLYNSTGTQNQSRLISRTALPEIITFGTDAPLTVILPLTNSPLNSLSGSRSLRVPLGWEVRAALSTAIATPVIVTAFGGSYA